LAADFQGRRALFRGDTDLADELVKDFAAKLSAPLPSNNCGAHVIPLLTSMAVRRDTTAALNVPFTS
jgi:hypothetical protein